MDIATIVSTVTGFISPTEIWSAAKERFEGLDIEVRQVSFRDVSKWDSVFAVITPNPIAYIGSFQISNGTPQRRGIKKVELQIDGHSFAWDEEPVEPFRTGDVRSVQWAFPANVSDPRCGPFILRLTDSTGKIRMVKGHLVDKPD